METEGETLCAAVLVTGGPLLDSSDTESEHEIDEDPEAYECAAVLVAGNMMINEVEQAKRKWCEDWLLRRNEMASYATLNKQLRLEQKLFCKYMRMPLPIFHYILNSIAPLIQKKDSNTQREINPESR